METMHFHKAKKDYLFITTFFSFGMHDEMPYGCRLGLITNSLTQGLWIYMIFSLFLDFIYIHESANKSIFK